MSRRPLIASFRGNSPRIAPTVFLAPTAVVVGDVVMKEGSSLWYGAVVRGDVEPIVVGRRTNLQDLVVVHVTGGQGPAVIGDGVTVGHRAVIHGCTIADDCLIGIGAVVLDGVSVGPESLVAAGAVVSPGTVIPPRSLARGVPARVTRELTEDEVTSIRRSAESYCSLSREVSSAESD